MSQNRLLKPYAQFFVQPSAPGLSWKSEIIPWKSFEDLLGKITLLVIYDFYQISNVKDDFKILKAGLFSINMVASIKILIIKRVGVKLLVYSFISNFDIFRNIFQKVKGVWESLETSWFWNIIVPLFKIWNPHSISIKTRRVIFNVINYINSKCQAWDPSKAEKMFLFRVLFSCVNWFRKSIFLGS